MNTEQMTARDAMVYELTRLSKRDLVATAQVLGASRGDHWIIGGPADWSKDELISYIAGPRETT